MARLSTFILLFCLFAISHAVPLDLPEDDVATKSPSISLTEPDTKTTILLPSEKPESEAPAILAELSESTTFAWDPVWEAEPKTIETTEELPEIETNTLEIKRPLTFATFRPVNRRFPFRPFFFRHHHRCHHHHHHHHQPREVSYGNDMILSDEENSEDDHHHHHHHHHHHTSEIPYGNDMILSDTEGGMREIPARWMRFHAHHGGRPRFGFKDEDKHFRHGEEEEEEKEDGGFRKRFRDEEDERETDGFMMRFRKFLNHHF